MKKLINIQFAVIFVTALTMGRLASGQISEVSGRTDGGPSGGAAPALASVSAPSDPASLPPATAAFVYYFEIQKALANDSLTNVAVNALALAQAVRRDPTGGFPAQFAAQADALARNAVTLEGARLDFAIVSGQLMGYLKAKNPPAGLGLIHMIYDPVTRLYWLQTGDPVQNPYLGKAGIPGKPLGPSNAYK